jgi:carbon storage regulator CsrA
MDNNVFTLDKISGLAVTLSKKEPRLRIGHDIVIDLIYTHGNQAKLKIKAPDDIPIHREKIYRKVFGEINGNR